MKQILLLVFLIPTFLMSQTINSELPTSINEDGSDPDDSAILDLQSTSKGVLFPRMDYEEIQDIGDPAEGLMVYDTEFKCLRMYNGSCWKCLFEDKDVTGAPGNLTSQSYGGSSIDAGYSIVVDDSDGSIIVGGRFSEDFTIGDTTLNSDDGSVDIFVVKFSNTLEFEWAISAGGSDDDYLNNLAVDDVGMIYATGYFQGTATFGDTTLTSSGGDDIYLAKYNPDGDFQWTVYAGGTTTGNRGEDVAIDPIGEIYVTGRFGGTAYFGTSSLTSNGGYDIFLAKYSKSGILKWVKSAGSTSSDQSYAVTVDVSKYAVITGYFSGSISFGSYSLTSAGGNDVFVARYSQSGTVQWAVSGGGSSHELGKGLITDATENIYVTGYFQETSDFSGLTVESEGSGDVFIAKYDNAGSLDWIESAGSSSLDQGYEVGLDSEDNVFVIGYMQGTATFDNNVYIGLGEEDLFIAKYDNSGTFQWADLMGGLNNEVGFSLVIDENDYLFFTGQFEKTARFGTSIHQSVESQDFLIGKYVE